MLTIDFVAKRYGILPSRLMQEGSSIDLYIADMAVSYENFIHQKDKNGGYMPPPEPSQEEMMALIEKTRKQQ